MDDQKKVLFRKSLGGFNRSDVQQYIVETAAQHKTEVAALRTQIDELTARLKTTADELADRKAEDEVFIEKVNEGTNELARLRAALEEKQGQLAASESAAELLRNDNEQKETQISELLAEIRSLQEAGARYAEEVAELERTKTYLVELELSARRRADDLEARAAEHIRSLRRSMSEQFMQALSRFDSFKNESDAFTARTIEQFGQMSKIHENLARELEETRKQFSNIMKELDGDNGFGNPAQKEAND